MAIPVTVNEAIVRIFYSLKRLSIEIKNNDINSVKDFKKIMDQLDYRKDKIEDWVKSCGYQLNDFELFVTRGALIKPLESGIYKVEEKLIEAIKKEVYAAHVSNVGMVIAYLWSQEHKIDAIFLNAPSTDELSVLARYTGIKGIERRTAFHALNQKQIALEYAQSIHKSVDDLKLIVVHLGGGISVGAHHHGRIVDVSNALDGEGCMSPERSGGLSARNIIQLYKELDYSDEKLFKLIAGKGGLVSHCGTNDVKRLLEQARTDVNVKEVIDAMIYQIVKEIGAMSTVLGQPIDAILITGGLAYSKEITDMITQKVSWISKVLIFPGEDEIRALALGAYRYLKHEEALKSIN